MVPRIKINNVKIVRTTQRISAMKKMSGFLFFLFIFLSLGCFELEKNQISNDDLSNLINSDKSQELNYSTEYVSFGEYIAFNDKNNQVSSTDYVPYTLDVCGGLTLKCSDGRFPNGTCQRCCTGACLSMCSGHTLCKDGREAGGHWSQLSPSCSQ